MSDWHGTFAKHVPMADVYVVTGDMLPNFPLMLLKDKEGKELTYDPFDHHSGQRPQGHFVGRILSVEHESKRQLEWCKRNPFRKNIGIDDDAPVVVVRGNHDFIDLSGWIGGDVFEIFCGETKEVKGLTFSGTRGINEIIGEWTDELDVYTFRERMRKVSHDIDVLVTHSPPYGVLDHRSEYIDSERWGSTAIDDWIMRASHFRVKDGHVVDGRLKAHLFGHVHEARGTVTIAKTLFSNAATGVNFFCL